MGWRRNEKNTGADNTVGSYAQGEVDAGSGGYCIVRANRGAFYTTPYFEQVLVADPHGLFLPVYDHRGFFDDTPSSDDNGPSDGKYSGLWVNHRARTNGDVPTQINILTHNCL